MITVFRAAPLLAAAFLFTACNGGDWGDNDRYREDFHYQYPLSAGGQLAVENSNGQVEISGWDQNTIEISGTKYASSRDMLNQIRIDVTHSPNSVRVRTVMPENWTGWHGSRGATYTIHVPHHVMLDQIQTSNGGIRVADIDGAVRLHTSNGGVHATNVKGQLELETSNGGIELYDASGNVHAHTSNGPIRGQIRSGSLDAGTSNGAIEVRLQDPPADTPVKADSSNGRISLEIAGQRVPEIRATTSNSSIDVRLPSSTNARLEAETSHGSVSSDFDVTTHGGRLEKSRLEGSIGSGGPVIELTSSNGSINVRKL